MRFAELGGRARAWAAQGSSAPSRPSRPSPRCAGHHAVAGGFGSGGGEFRLSEAPTDRAGERDNSRRNRVESRVVGFSDWKRRHVLRLVFLVFARERDGGLPAPGEAGVSASARLDAADGLVVDVEAPRSRLPGRPGGELVRFSGEKPGDGLEGREEQRASGTAAGRVVRETRRRVVEEQATRGRDPRRGIHGEQADDHRHRAQRHDGEEEDAAGVPDPRGARHGAHIRVRARWRRRLRRGAERRRCRRVVRVRV